MQIRLQEAPFDHGKEVADFTHGCSGIGAVVTFCGIVRDLPDEPLQQMQIEHYPGMTERALTQIAQQAAARWAILDCLILHRYGVLLPKEPIMMVATAARHRADAFAAADFLMDYLKSRAPFWKKETTAKGSAWVDARSEDEDALLRWGASRTSDPTK